MKQENFLFVDLVSSIFLIALLLGNMFGMLYITDGNIAISLIASLLIVVFYYFILQMLKKNKEYIVGKNYMAPQSLFFLVFVLFGFVSFILINHFWTVETTYKEKIQQDSDQKIESLQNIITEYGRRSDDDLQTLEGKLTTLLTQLKSNNSASLKNTLSQDPYKIDQRVLATPGYINVQDVVNSSLEPVRKRMDADKKSFQKVFVPDLKNFKSDFDSWNRLTIMQTYADLKQYYSKAGKFLNQKMAELPYSKTPVTLKDNKEITKINDPMEMLKESKDFWLPLLFVLITHLFILIPYFTYKVRKYKNNTGSTGPISGGIEI